MPTAADARLEVARLIGRQVQRKPDSVLGLATGSTPVGVYALLAEMHARGELDFSRVTSFNLDEYVGIGPEHPASYRYYMDENLFRRINIRRENTYLPDGMTADIPGHCAAYEEAIRRAGGIDLQLLGVGGNGHIAFNEPGSSLASRTRLKTLAPQTAADNARFFPDPTKMPLHVITMGVGTVMEARQCVLLATGANKTDIVARFVEGPVSAFVPASVLQLHPNAVIVLDEAAAAKLVNSEYYRWVYDHKPAWQRV